MQFLPSLFPDQVAESSSAADPSTNVFFILAISFVSFDQILTASHFSTAPPFQAKKEMEEKLKREEELKKRCVRVTMELVGSGYVLLVVTLYGSACRKEEQIKRRQKEVEEENAREVICSPSLPISISTPYHSVG